MKSRKLLQTVRMKAKGPRADRGWFVLRITGFASRSTCAATTATQN